MGADAVDDVAHAQCRLGEIEAADEDERLLMAIVDRLQAIMEISHERFRIYSRSQNASVGWRHMDHNVMGRLGLQPNGLPDFGVQPVAPVVGQPLELIARWSCRCCLLRHRS